MKSQTQFGRSLLAVVCACLVAAGAAAQSEKELAEMRARAFELMKQSNTVAAVPLLETLAKAFPEDARVQDNLAMALLVSSANIQDPELRKKGRIRAREVAEKAKQLAKGQKGYYEVVLQIPEDGSETGFSKNQEVERAMREAEAAYSKGELEKAFEGYVKALAIEPQLYEAALYCGDVLFKQGKNPEAWPWFARAIEIDPRRETSYRYWGDSLLATGRNDEAREKFFDAILAEPYNRLSWNGLFNWSRRTGVQLTHPRVASPNKISSQGDRTNITIDASALDAKDGMNFWMLYEMSRAAWRAEGYFQKQFPEEKEYRHSLKEEADALSAVARGIAEAREKNEIAALHPSLEPLLKLHNDGLIEAYVVLARADQGIVRDYAAYAGRHREKLRKYLSHYVAPVVAPQ